MAERNDSNGDSQEEFQQDDGGNQPSQGDGQQDKTPSRNATSEIDERFTIEIAQKIDSAFNSFKVYTVEFNDNHFEMISFNELPSRFIQRVSQANGKRQIKIMGEYVQLCLVDPTQWRIIQEFEFSDFNEFVKRWLNSKH